MGGRTDVWIFLLICDWKLMLYRYLKCIDRFYNNYVSCFMTGGSKFVFWSSLPWR